MFNRLCSPQRSAYGFRADDRFAALFVFLAGPVRFMVATLWAAARRPVARRLTLASAR